MIDLLRCVNAHEDTWLVASFREITNRMVREGTLGCPVCSAEYRIRNGVADFALGETTPAMPDTSAADTGGREELATDAGAYLNATQPGATIILGGGWARAAHQLAAMTDVRVIALNAPATVRESDRVGLVRVGTRIPLATNSAHGIALDASFPALAFGAALRVVKQGGRVVGPVSAAVPTPTAVLARNEKHWIAAKAAEMIPIRRSHR